MIHLDSKIKTNKDNYLYNYSTGKENSQIIIDSEGERRRINSGIEIEVIEGTGEILIDVTSSGRTRKWSEKKEMNRELVEILKEFRNRYPELLSWTRLIQVEECANYLKYEKRLKGIKKLVEANFCRFKLCPICIWRKSLKIFSQVSAVTEVLNREYSSSRYIFVTLTVKNVSAEELSSSIDRMNEGFKKLVQKSKSIAEAKVFKESLLGYLKSMEITYNKKTREYHPHIHAIFHLRASYFGNKYLSHEKWVNIWKSMMNLDYEPQVKIKSIKKGESDNFRFIGEIAKYPIKSSDILGISNLDEQMEVLYTLLSSTYHRRFVTFGGTFRDIKRRLALDDVETGSLVEVETSSDKFNHVVYEIYRYDFKYGCYIC